MLACTEMETAAELELEEDGRWIAEVVGLPGVLVYGDNPERALRSARALAVRVLADKIAHGDLDSSVNGVEFLPPHPFAAV